MRRHLTVLLYYYVATLILCSYPRCETRSELISTVDHAWDRPVASTPQSPAQYDYFEDGATWQKLESIQIPKVEFNQTPLSRVVSMLSRLSEEFDPSREGLNILLINPLGEDPLVDISLRNLNLGEIIGLVAKTAGFVYDIEGNVVTLQKGDLEQPYLKTQFFPITRATVARITGHRAPQQAGPLNPVDFDTTQKEEEYTILHFLQRAGIPFDAAHHGPQGAQLAYDGTQLIVTQTPRNLHKVRNLLERYKNTLQVEIESKFIEVQQGVLEELGLQWNASNSNNSSKFARSFDPSTSGPQFNNLRPLAGTFNTNNSLAGDGKITFDSSGNTSAIANFAPIFPNAINLGLGATPIGSVLGVLDNWQLNVLVQALEQHTGADLMTAPKVTVLSGKTAKITVAQVLRYPEAYGDIASAVGIAGGDGSNSSAGVTITAGTPKNFVEKNVGVEMQVTPTVEFDGRSVNLRLDPKVTEFEGFVEYGGRSLAISNGVTADLPSGFFQPIFSTREISTEVTIYDGATVVMGGLTREEVKEVHDRVPVLGSLPLVGRLFRSDGETSQKKNLLIFVTANIINEGGSTTQNNRLPAVRSGAVYRAPLLETPEGLSARK